MASGFNFTLSEGKEAPQSAQTLPVASASPLSDAETQALLDRLPPLPVETSDRQEFKLPAQSLLPPRPGATISETFPPADSVLAATAPALGDAPLEVVRYAPAGEIRLAPFLQVTFNQPMVPLAMLEQLKAEEIPVKITPALPGVWKWLGTKTLVFEYKAAETGDPKVDRFPKATEYKVEIPAGTKSASGKVLESAVTWSFTTPPPILQYTYPYSYQPQPRNPLLFASFDQRIDAAAMLQSLAVNAGGQQYKLQLVPPEVARQTPAIDSLARQAGEGRWLAFRATSDFPADTTINVSVLPGAPSAEGPLTTVAAQGFNFQTYAPLRVTDYSCSTTSDPCPAGVPFYIGFNNSLNEDKFDPAFVSISPAIANSIIEAHGNSLSIRGVIVGRTTYKIALKAQIEDVFGQTLGKDQEITIKTGPAERVLSGPNSGITTLDPTPGKPTLTFYTTNYDKLRLRVYAVTPQDWSAYLAYLRDYWNTDTPLTPPGRELTNTTLPLQDAPDQLNEQSLDLSQWVGEQGGHLIVSLDNPPGLIASILGRRDYNVIHTWVQVTKIGLDAFVDPSEMVAWATDLRDGKPLNGVRLSFLNDSNAVASDESGVARLPLTSTPQPLLIGELQGDIAILPQNTWDYYGGSGWQLQSISDELRWYVFDDRQMYRPGEEIHVKGWLRQIGGKQDGDVGLPQGATSVRYQVIDPQGNTLADAMTDLNDLGGFDLAFTLPENVNLGSAAINFNAVGSALAQASGYYHTFQIQEFRRPEFEVSANNESTGPFFLGDEATVAVSAQYFAGGPLPNAETIWNVNASPSSYSPPKWPDFIFGEWTPWWIFSFGGDVYSGAPGSPYRDLYGMSQPTQSFNTKTDAAGKHYLKLRFGGQFDDKTLPRPYSLNAEAVVMDVNRQAWAATTNLLVHPASVYVGLRSQQIFVQQGQPLEIDFIIADVDGKAISGLPVKLRAARMEWTYRKGNWRQEERDVQTCEMTSTSEPQTCTFEAGAGGEYKIVAQVRDERERLNQSSLTRWVSGGKQPVRRNVEQEQVTLIPDKQSYQPGDTAKILVQSPFSPAEGLLTVTRSGILYSKRLVIEDGTTTLEIPIEEAHIPNLNIQVDLNGSAPRTDDNGEPLPEAPAHPAYATGSLNLAIPPLSRTLQVAVAPVAPQTAPGVETSVAVTLTDAAGQPVENGEVAVVVVDEAVLALTGYQLSDPLAAFYSQRGSFLNSYYGRSSIVLANPEQLAAMMAGGMGGGSDMVMAAAAPAADGALLRAAPTMAMQESMPMEAPAAAKAEGQAGAPIAVRSDFNPLAVFAPAVRTDATGKAAVTFNLPDNLTRYRVMAVAVADGKRYGMGEANLTARLPLMVRPSAPRFLNFGDRFDLPIVLQNQTDEAMTVQVALRATNLSGASADANMPATTTLVAGQQLTIAANDRVEVRFPTQTQNAGTARFQVAVAAGDFADAASIELPVYTPATTEAFAVYGVVDEGAIAQPVARPQNVYPQFGGLEINTSSTALQALTDAVLYLQNYPFECSEQLASRILGIASLRDVLTAFNAAGLPSTEAMEAAIERDIARLQQLQNFDGGWPVWEKGRESTPYYSIHVAHALQRARMKGFNVKPEMIQLSLDHLRNIENYYPVWYSLQTRHVLSAYAVYVRYLMGDGDTVKARNLVNQYPLEDQSLEAVAWLWQVLGDDPASQQEVQAIRRHVANRAVETAGAANFVTSYGDQEWLLLHSNRRTDGILLDALINDKPDSDLIPKVVNGLLNQRTAGRWGNTQENAFILLALDRYFNTFEAQTPDFVARIWLGDTYAGEHVYAGRTTERHETAIPMSFLLGEQAGANDAQTLILSKEGQGRLYYRLGLGYAPSDLNLPPLDMGFVVQRSYEAVDDPADVRRDEDGMWRIKAGARVRVRIQMVADNRRYHVALVDPLPAGLEIINPALAVSENIPRDPNTAAYGWWWYGTWYEHQNLRDQRAEAFTSLLWEGVYDYDYVARATTPGEFVVPPSKAEEMYSPEVFGRSGIDKVVIE